MKKAATVLAIISLLFAISCSQETQAPKNIDVTPVAGSVKGLDVSSADTITLRGLENGKLYGINVIGASSGSRSAAPGLIPTDGGTQLLLSDGSEVSFTGAELGISDTGFVTVIEYLATDDDMTINTNDEPLYYYVDQEGYRCEVFEEYYEVDIKRLAHEGLERDEVAFFSYDVGGGDFSTDYRVVELDESGKWRTSVPNGVIDMTHERFGTIYIFSQVVRRKGDLVQEIVIQNPRVVGTANEPATEIIPRRGLYQVKKDDCPEGQKMVIELDMGNSELWNFDFSYNVIDSRYAYGDNAGQRKPYLFPFAYDYDVPNKVLLYVGEVTEDFIFDIYANDNGPIEGTMTLRPILTEELAKIVFVDLGKEMADGYWKFEKEVSAGSAFTPVVFEHADKCRDFEIRSHYPDRSITINFVSGHSDGVGYSQDSKDDLDIWSLPRNNTLEYARITNYNNQPAEVKIELSANGNGFDSIGQQIVEVDGAELKEALSDINTLSWDDKLVFKNLIPGHVYGIHFDFDARGNNRFVWVADGYLVFLATGTEMSIDASEFEITGSCNIKCNHLITQDELRLEASESTALFTDSKDAYVAVKAFNISGLEPGNDYFLRTERNGDGESYGRSTTFFSKNGDRVRDMYHQDIYSFDEEEAVLVYSQSVKDGSFTTDLSMVGADELDMGVQQDFILPGLYIVEANSDKELVLEMTFKAGQANWYSLDAIREGSAYDMETGESLPCFLAFNFDADNPSTLAYIGQHDGKVLILMPQALYDDTTMPDKISVREIRKEEIEQKAECTYPLSKGTTEITLDPSQTGTTIFLEDVEYGVSYEVSAKFENEDDGNFYIRIIGDDMKNIDQRDPSMTLEGNFGLKGFYVDGSYSSSLIITVKSL